MTNEELLDKIMYSQVPQVTILERGEYRAELLRRSGAAVSASPNGPIRLSDQQEEVVKLWAADSRLDLWGNDEARAFNLRVFARAILAQESQTLKMLPKELTANQIIDLIPFRRLKEVYEEFKDRDGGRTSSIPASPGPRPVCPECKSEKLEMATFQASKSDQVMLIDCQDCETNFSIVANEGVYKLADFATFFFPASLNGEKRAPELDDSRCAVCGWPLAESAEKGCIRGNCSMRPFPDNIYDPERANKEYKTERFTRVAATTQGTPEGTIE